MDRDLNEIAILSESKCTLRMFQVANVEFFGACDNGCIQVNGDGSLIAVNRRIGEMRKKVGIANSFKEFG